MLNAVQLLDARHAATQLTNTSDDTSMSPGIRLLEAIRSALAVNDLGQISSAELARTINDSEAWPTKDVLDVRELATRLRPYDLGPRLLRHGNEVFRGYRCADFDDAFARYLEPRP